jgi:DNA-nicking Smr family endonuclease
MVYNSLRNMSKLTHEDQLYWKAATKAVKKAKHIDEHELDNFFPVKKPKAKITAHIAPKKIPYRTEAARSLIEGEVNFMDGSNFSKLKRGEININARLDLHGYKLDEAYAKTCNFIASCQRNRKRCVLIITGKSGNIKKEFSHWVNTPEIADLVLSFTPASPRDGGSGAYYLMLKK